ncbi:MAG: DUF2974 domain-containing protein [Solobacterium sp.]|nr:DUF2974 domain-containing protein [Solobacterium sp.]
MNILDYIRWRGDLPFARDPVNEVDHLIFTELAYTKMEDIVGFDRDAKSIREIRDSYIAHNYNQSEVGYDPKPTLEACGASERFGNITARSYVNVLDTDPVTQFSAVTFALDDGTDYIAFRGTDNTIIGWQEDFHFACSTGTEGQREAAAYITYIADHTDRPLRIGGHSKGGHLAIYGAAMCREDIQDRILEVVSCDGPGFRDDFLTRKEFERIHEKILLIAPEASFIGRLMKLECSTRIIRSSESMFQQHNPYSWCVLGKQFETCPKFTTLSTYLDNTLDTWLAGLSDKERLDTVDMVFDCIHKAGIRTVAEMSANPIKAWNAILNELKEVDPEAQQHATDVMKKLASAGTSVIWDEVKGAFWKDE